jgi:uncharacterized membrane protein YgcG
MYAIIDINQLLTQLLNYHMLLIKQIKSAIILGFSLIIGVFGLSFFSPFQINLEAYGANSTPEIAINISQISQDKLLINYLITQTFEEEDSHGIFLALPKNQDGIWTDYNIKSVEISKELGERCGFDNAQSTVQCANKDFKIDQTTPINFRSEKYEEIKEWNELRVRVGDKDQVIEKGTYLYKIEIEATINTNYNYSFTVLNDWGDPVDNISAFVDQKDICTNKDCDSSNITVELNPGKNPTNLVTKIIKYIWPYLIILPFLYAIIYFIWYKFARDDSHYWKAKSPRFEPPKVLPWEASFIAKEGQIDLKNTLLSYILWLNNQGYISLKPNNQVIVTDKNIENDKVSLTIIRELPKVLPDIFNRTVELIAKNGVKAGLLSSKINPGAHQGLTNNAIRTNLKNYYLTRPFNYPSLAVIAYGLIGIVSFFIIYSLLKNMILLGESYLTLSLISFVLTIPGAVFIAKYWGKLNTEGARIRGDIEGYKYYLQKAETLKLDFSNNPNEGVQYYLTSVPFAAAFGILPQFQKYISKLIPEATNEINMTDNFTTAYLVSSFYSPPSDSSFDSGGGGGGFDGGGGSW